MSNEVLPEPREKKSDSTALTYRPQDQRLYAGIGAYFVLVIAVIGFSHGRYDIIEAGKAFGLFIPLLLLMSLIGMQIFHHPRFSPVAFSICILVVLIQAFITLMIAGAASAAV